MIHVFNLDDMYKSVKTILTIKKLSKLIKNAIQIIKAQKLLNSKLYF